MYLYLMITAASSVQSLSCVQLSVTPWTAARQASLSITNSQSSLKLMSIELVMPSNHLILCRPLLLPPLIFPSTRVFSNSCPSNQWCHPTILSSVVPFFSCLQSFPASGSFPMSWLFTSGGQSIAASASVLPMNTQDWSPLGWTGWISLLSKGL